jgi:hypothetical protein
MTVRLRATHRYTHTVHLRRDVEQVGTLGDQELEGGYKNGENACATGAAGVTAGYQDIATKPACRVITSKPPEMRYRGYPYLGRISIASTLIRLGRGLPASVSPLMGLMSSRHRPVSSSEENCLCKRKTDLTLAKYGAVSLE